MNIVSCNFINNENWKDADFHRMADSNSKIKSNLCIFCLSGTKILKQADPEELIVLSQ